MKSLIRTFRLTYNKRLLKPIPLIEQKSPHGEKYFSNLSTQVKNSISKEIAEDSFLDVPNLVTKYGYPIETHEIQTKDGYLLTLHRMPSGKSNKKENRIPVLLIHGLLSSSADWVVNGPGKAFGYILADEGYDVWMGNVRGNYYSRKHVSLNPEKSKYWKFTWSEVGSFDLPAMIDYVLDKTEYEKLHYIGHSQGTTSFFVMSSDRPEYNAKIKSMQALAPVAFLKNAKSPILRYLAPFARSINMLLSMIGVNEFLPATELTKRAGHLFCNEKSIFQPICAHIIFAFAGYSPDQLNKTMLPIYISHNPAGTSCKQVVHYTQMFLSGKFCQYDYGSLGNLYKYNLLSPPNYSLKSVTAPVAIHYSDNDWLADPIDVLQLHNELPNSVGLFRVPLDTFNHLDFLWGIDAKPLLYDSVVKLMRKFDKT